MEELEAVVEPLQEAKERGASVCNDELEIGMALEHTAIDHSGYAQGGVEGKSDTNGQRVARHVLGEARQHRMLGDREPKRSDAGPDRLEAAVVERDAIEVRADPDADDAGRGGDALELLQRGLDIGQRQGAEAAHAVGIALRARD